MQSNDADSTDVVTRATEHGAQMIAILADESASGRVAFSLDLPEGARLEPSNDGTVDIVRDIEVERPTVSAGAELDARITAILGDSPPDSSPSDEQITALEGIPVPQMEVSRETIVMASITAPWAIDADGQTLATEYEVDGNTITQVVDTRGAAFPVVADPDIWWVVANSAGCLAEIAGLGLASAKAVAAFAKADKIVRAAKKLGYYYDRLGGRMDKVIGVIKKWINSRGSLTRTQLSAVEGLIREGGKIFFNALGLGSCYNLVSAKW